VVYLERKRLAALRAAESAGEDVWTEDLNEAVRTKMLALWLHLPSRLSYESVVQNNVERIMLTEAAVPNAGPIDVVLRDGPIDLALSYVDAIAIALRARRGVSYITDLRYDQWCTGIAKIFEAHRLKFKFINGEVIPLGSEVMHAQVVEPTLVLLHGKREFTNAEKSFRDALEELVSGKPDDAITDAGTALQEALIAVGCKGNALGELIKDAKQKSWFGPRDSPLADSIAKIHTWIAAERNAGEAHRVSHVSKDDAWFVVHVVGAAIVRLAAGPRTDP
jgi:hypothetical protein